MPQALAIPHMFVAYCLQKSATVEEPPPPPPPQPATATTNTVHQARSLFLRPSEIERGAVWPPCVGAVKRASVGAPSDQERGSSRAVRRRRAPSHARARAGAATPPARPAART